MTIVIQQLTDESRASTILAMMAELYAEDAPAYSRFDIGRCRATIREFVENPSSGSVLVFSIEDTPVGYALLVPYWSNEFGGRIVFIDELFVSKPYRGAGIGSEVLRRVARGDFGIFVANALEVSAKNERALKLYRDNGFEIRGNRMMVRVP